MFNFSTSAQRVTFVGALAATQLICTYQIVTGERDLVTTAFRGIAHYREVAGDPRWLINVTTRSSDTVGLVPPAWVPKTALGRKLAEARAAVIASGATLLSADEINKYLERSRFEA